jgi:pimeloyl-ACP methyl ester carboxylesterase
MNRQMAHNRVGIAIFSSLFKSISDRKYDDCDAKDTLFCILIFIRAPTSGNTHTLIIVKHIFIFSGLGADERIFQNLKLPGYNFNFIKWIQPFQKESIEDYATRILEQIYISDPILLGVSFGGIMAIEVAKQMKISELILISTVKTKFELPVYYRLAGFIGLHKILPTKLLKASNFFTNWLFGVSAPSEKQLLKQIISDTDSLFLNWAIDKIASWQNSYVFEKALHIHGIEDKLLPIVFTKPNKRIEAGGHLMVLTCSDEIATIIADFLQTHGTESKIHGT